MKKLPRVKLTTDHKAQLKKMGVELIYLFGSFAEGFATTHSDIDIGIVFKNPRRYERNTLKAFVSLHRLFSGVYFTCPEVDIVFLQFAPIALQAKAVMRGQLLFESERGAHVRYIEAVMRHRADLQFFLDRHQQAILARV